MRRNIMWKIVLFVVLSAGCYASTNAQQVVTEYQLQNVQYPVTNMVPVTTIVNQQVWVPVVRVIPVQYLVPIQTQVIHRSCLLFDRWNDARVQNNYWITPYRVYNY